MPRPDRHPGGAGDRSAQARRDDRSGLIDIRALSSIVDAQRRGGPSASASSVALPSFSTPWTMQPMRDLEPRAIEPRAQPKAGPSSDRPLYVMLASLSLAVVSLGAYVVLRPAPEPVIEVAMAPAVVAEEVEREAAAEPPEAEAEPESQPVAAPSVEGEGEAQAGAEQADESESAEAEPSRPRASRPRARRERRPARADAPAPTPKPRKEESVSVECVLDPSSCGRGKAALPKTPSASQIRDAMAVVKPQAKACAGRHGGAGEKVRVKLSAKGSTGAITSARPLDEHEGTALGRCVAGALTKAKLPRFSKSQAGIVYTIRL